MTVCWWVTAIIPLAPPSPRAKPSPHDSPKAYTVKQASLVQRLLAQMANGKSVNMLEPQPSRIGALLLVLAEEPRRQRGRSVKLHGRGVDSAGLLPADWERAVDVQLHGDEVARGKSPVGRRG